MLSLLIFTTLLVTSYYVPIWHDEHIFYRFTWVFTNLKEASSLDFILDYSRQAYHPPLFLSLLAIVSKLFNFFELTSVYTFRFISSCLSSLAFYFLFKFISRKKYSQLGLIFIIFLQVDVWFYFFEIGPYSFLFLISTLYVIYCERLQNLTDINWKCYLKLTLLTITLSYTHYFGTIMLLVNGIVGIYFSMKKKPLLKLFLFSHFAAFIAFLPWYFQISSKVVTSIKAATGTVSINYLDMMNFNFSIGANILFLTLVVFYICIIGLKINPKHCVAFILFIVLVNIRSIVSTPLFEDRYNFSILPTLFIAFSIGSILIPYRNTFLIILFLIFGTRFADFRDALGARWFNPVAHIKRVTSIMESSSTSDIGFYYQLNSPFEFSPYDSQSALSNLKLYPVGRYCKLDAIANRSIFLTADIFCDDQELINQGFKLNSAEYGMKIWTYKL